MDDNFWSMGIPGPCGPCSELYYDRGPDYGQEGGPEVDEDRYLEFWNLVFMQNERGPSTGPGKSDYPILGELPAKNIDTGMGMERMAALLQGVDNLYEIDQTRPILDRAAELAGKVYGAHSGHAASESHPDDVRLRVIADHVRSALMLIGDGVTPEQRRARLRAAPHHPPGGALDAAARLRAAVPADAAAGRARLHGAVLPRTGHRLRPDLGLRLRRGGGVPGDAARRHVDVRPGRSRAWPSRTRRTLPGEQAFLLHDTYGFPIDLTLEMAAEQGVAVDEAGFRRLMAEQRARAKADASAKKVGHGDLSAYRAALELGGSDFTGYREIARESLVTALVGEDGLLPAAGEGDEVLVVLDATPFYAEGGGQQSDWGRITINAPDHTGELTVLDVQSPLPGLIAHRVLGAQRRGPSGRRSRWPRSTSTGAARSRAATRRPTCCTGRCAATSARPRRRPVR